MEYKLEVSDKAGWIDYILEIKNTEDTLVLITYFNPPYVRVKSASVYRQGTRYGGFYYKNGQQTGAVLVTTKEDTCKYVNFERHSATLVFLKDFDPSMLKRVYSGVNKWIT